MKRRSTLSLALGLVACLGCNITVDVGDGGAGGSAGSGGGAGGGAGGSSSGADFGAYFTCSASKACPSGQFCFNGLCALGCQNNGQCAADQYCDTEWDRLCHNRVVPTCADASACASTQLCVSGFCSTPPPATQCNPDGAYQGQDGCASNALCVDPTSTPAKDPQCYTQPACAPDKTCPVGLAGAVCNDGYVPNKGKICLTNICRVDAHCPANWSCFRFANNDVLGVCSNHGFGAPCKVPADCTSGSCTVLGFGFGMCN